MTKAQFVQWRLDSRSTQLDEMDEIWKATSQVNLTDDFFADLQGRADSNLNYIMSAFGGQGSGKSYSVIYVAEKMAEFCGVELNLDYIVFRTSDALTTVKNMPKKSILVVDEQVFSAGTGSRLEQEQLRNIERVVRKKQLSFFFLAPDFIDHAFHNYMETWQMGSDKAWDWKIPAQKQWKWTKSLLYNRRGNLLGHIVTGKVKNQDFMKRYEEKKDFFLEKILSSETTGRFSDLIKWIHNDILKDPNFEKKWEKLKSGKLKTFYLQVKSRGKMISTEQMGRVVQYIDFYLKTGETFDDILSPTPESPKKVINTK